MQIAGRTVKLLVVGLILAGVSLVALATVPPGFPGVRCQMLITQAFGGGSSSVACLNACTNCDDVDVPDSHCAEGEGITCSCGSGGGDANRCCDLVICQDNLTYHIEGECGLEPCPGSECYYAILIGTDPNPTYRFGVCVGS